MALGASDADFAGVVSGGHRTTVVVGEHGGNADDASDAEGNGAAQTGEQKSRNGSGDGDEDKGSFHDVLNEWVVLKLTVGMEEGRTSTPQSCRKRKNLRKNFGGLEKEGDAEGAGVGLLTTDYADYSDVAMIQQIGSVVQPALRNAG